MCQWTGLAILNRDPVYVIEFDIKQTVKYKNKTIFPGSVNLESWNKYLILHISSNYNGTAIYTNQVPLP